MTNLLAGMTRKKVRLFPTKMKTNKIFTLLFIFLAAVAVFCACSTDKKKKMRDNTFRIEINPVTVALEPNTTEPKQFTALMRNANLETENQGVTWRKDASLDGTLVTDGATAFFTPNDASSGKIYAAAGGVETSADVVILDQEGYTVKIDTSDPVSTVPISSTQVPVGAEIHFYSKVEGNNSGNIPPVWNSTVGARFSPTRLAFDAKYTAPPIAGTVDTVTARFADTYTSNSITVTTYLSPWMLFNKTLYQGIDLQAWWDKDGSASQTIFIRDPDSSGYNPIEFNGQGWWSGVALVFATPSDISVYTHISFRVMRVSGGGGPVSILYQINGGPNEGGSEVILDATGHVDWATGTWKNFKYPLPVVQAQKQDITSPFIFAFTGSSNPATTIYVDSVCLSIE
jgi:hypothetical protein